jgi:hypothetical protein
MGRMGRRVVARGAGPELVATGGTTPGRKTAQVASAAGCASNGLPDATKP